MYKNSVRYEESLLSYRWFIKCLFLGDTDVRIYVGALPALVLVTCMVAGWHFTPIYLLDAGSRNKNKICRSPDAVTQNSNKNQWVRQNLLSWCPWLYCLSSSCEVSGGEQRVCCTWVVHYCTEALEEVSQKHRWRFDTQLLVASSGMELFHFLSSP